MSTPGDGGAAFPVLDNPGIGLRLREPGMTLRDYFAAKAMPVLIANMTNPNADDVAMWAYRHADAMLAERAKVRP